MLVLCGRFLTLRQGKDGARFKGVPKTQPRAEAVPSPALSYYLFWSLMLSINQPISHRLLLIRPLWLSFDVFLRASSRSCTSSAARVLDRMPTPMLLAVDGAPRFFLN